MKLIPKEKLNLPIPDYFINYGINPDKFYSMYDSLKKKGLDHPIAFYAAWQSIKEKPNGWYAFGVSKKNLQEWADSVYKSVTSGLYKNTKDVKDYNTYANKAHKYNTSNSKYWTNWLPNGMDDAENYINQRQHQSLSAPKIKLGSTYGTSIEVPVSTRVEFPQVLEPSVISHKLGGKLTYFL